MWAARAWNRIWKKQGIPARGYDIVHNQLNHLLDDFDEQQKEIFSNGASAAEVGFDSEAIMNRMREATENIFSPEANE